MVRVGIQPFPASGNLRLDFRFAKMRTTATSCRVLNPGIVSAKTKGHRASVLLFWRRLRDSLRKQRLLSRLSRKQPFHRLFGRLAFVVVYGIVCKPTSNPFEALNKQKKRNTNSKCSYFSFMAEAEGFEPPWVLPKRFSRPPRYDRFDKPPFIRFFSPPFRFVAMFMLSHLLRRKSCRCLLPSNFHFRSTKQLYIIFS